LAIRGSPSPTPSRPGPGSFGTGKYAGISGSCTYQLSILGIGAKSGGKCVQNKPPVAFHQVINASGPVCLT
jgi:hypothetical protein